MTGSNGRDWFINDADYVTTDAGMGNDTIVIARDYNSVNGGDGDDSIIVHGIAPDYNTIHGGKGDDTVAEYANCSVIEYVAGDGNDVISYLYEGSKDTIWITDGSSYSTTASGNDILINVGTGSMLLKNVVGTSLNIVSGALTEENSGRRISNWNNHSVVSGSGYDDTIYNYASNVTITASGGNDYIRSPVEAVSIIGDSGKDSIYLDGYSSVTVNGGRGNDYITGWGSYRVYQYAAGDGNDTIVGFKTAFFGGDMIMITDGADYSTKVSGSDVIVSIGEGAIRLQNVSSKDIRISNGSGSSPSDGINNVKPTK